MFDEIFSRKRLNVEKASLYGFVMDENCYKFETVIMEGLFRLQLFASLTGTVETKLFEQDTDEEYILYKTSSSGVFVKEVREAVEAVLLQVSKTCYDIEVFHFSQTKEVIDYVLRKYGDDLEFLWKKFPDNAVWRRKDTHKWYGAILTVSKKKLGIDSDEVVEIIDLRIQPEKMDKLLMKKGYYPGWHMNKKSWYTVILDGSITTEEICRHIDESYCLAH